MNALNETNVISRQVIPYLESLGYPSQLIRSHVRTNLGRLVDVVIFRENDEPYIVVEVKGSEIKMPSRDENELRYDSLVRQVHLYAKELKAPYMLLSNGEDHYWFASDSTGRPKLLENPVVYGQPDEILLSSPSLTALSTVFIRLRELGSYKTIINTPVLLMAKITSEWENIPLEKAWNVLANRLLQTKNISSSFGRNDMSQLLEATRILEMVRLNEYSTTDLLGTIDKIFINYQLRKNQPRISRWLSDFMVRLGQIDKSSRVLDIYCGFGDILAAAKLAESGLAPTSTYGIFGLENIGSLGISVKEPYMVVGQKACTLPSRDKCAGKDGPHLLCRSIVV